MKSYIWNPENMDGTYSNPILYTDYSDPDAIRVGDDYYMIASSFCNAPGIPLLHSKDLLHWDVINYVLQELPGEQYDQPRHGCGVWAPAIRYHEGTFYVCFPMSDEGIYMSTAKDPYGAWSRPVCIRPGAGWIDPCPFWDEDGKAYLVAGVAKSRIGYNSVLYIVEMRPDGLELIGEEIRVFDGNENGQNTIEGPKLYKRNGYYYIFAPAGGVKKGWQTVLRSKNIYGPYEHRVVLSQGDTDINGPHQGAWIDTVTGEDYFLHFQDVYAAGRIVHLQPMKWEQDWPVMGNLGTPVNRWKKPTTGAITEAKSEPRENTSVNLDQANWEPPTSDDFMGDSLGLQWQWNANPKKGFYTLEKGALKLFACQKTVAYGDMPNLLLQKWPAPEFATIYELDLSHLEEGNEAGVISMGMEYGLVSICRKSDTYQVSTVLGKQIFGSIFVKDTEEKTTSISQLDLSQNKVFIKYLVERDGFRDLNEKEKHFPKEKVTISISNDGLQYENLLTMTAVPGRWVGVKNGLFCMYNSRKDEDAIDNDKPVGYLQVNNVTYHKIYHNPVVRGFFPDPSVVRVGRDYYMVNSTFQYFPAIAISHSTDMVHWELIGHAITNPEDLDIGAIRDSHGIWAPDIEYVDGQFVIMATLRLNGDGTRDNNVLRRQLVVTSKTPEGPYSKPAWIEVDDIDPSLFVNDDGRKYMCISPGVNVVELSDDCTKQVGEKICVWPGTGERCPEGPHLFKRGDYYYAVLAEGGTGYGHGINVARSKNLFGPYEPSPYNPVLRQLDETSQLQRCGHGKFIEDADGNWWVYYLCGRCNEGHYTTIGRETALEPVRWLEDGWFVINEGLGPGRVNIAPNLPTMHVERWERDDFDSEVLNKNWEFVRIPHPGFYSLTERKGYFRIWTQDGTLSEIRMKNVLLRREQELSYEALTKLDFHPQKDGEQAGLTCYYSTATYARCSVCFEKGRKLQLVINRNHGEELIASVDLPESEIFLRVQVHKLSRKFSYSFDGETWEELAHLTDCIYLCDEGVPDDPKRHTGTLVGIYASNGGCGSRIPADFDFFAYKDE